MLDKSGRGNHATQATAIKRPVLSSRGNLLLNTETLSTQSVTVAATSQTLRFEGTGSVTLSGTATGTYSAGTHTLNTTAGSLTLTVSGSVTRADLRASNDGVGLPPYQYVNTPTDYDSGPDWPRYLRFDGIDDGMVTGTITPGTDKVQVFAGVRKLSDVGFAPFLELSAAISNGSFNLSAPGGANSATFGFASRGSTATAGIANSPTTFSAPITAVLCGIGSISEDISNLQINGIASGSGAADQGTGNYLSYPLYIGRRGGTSNPFNGRLYPLIVRFGPTLTAEQITQTETWVNGKTRAYA
jgi:hypothetical protein